MSAASLAGYLNILKPPGMTSSDVVTTLRRALKPYDPNLVIGHAGTLDPEAAGVLPIMLGRGARMFDYLTDKVKEYVAECVFGIATDTQDSTGRITDVSHNSPTIDGVKAALPQFIGEILQKPSAYSAIKQDGTPLYVKARRGETVSPDARKVTIDDICVIAPTDRGLTLRIICRRGVYIRALCHDIGQALGCAAHMGFLIRTRAGSFDIENSVTLEEVMSTIRRDEPDLPRFYDKLLPLDLIVMDLPRLDTTQQALTKQIISGNPIAREKLTTPLSPVGIYRLYAGPTYVGIVSLDTVEARVTVRMIQ